MGRKLVGDDTQGKVKVEKLLELLDRVHVNGVFEQCVLIERDGLVGSIGVDLTDTVVMSCFEKISGLKIGKRKLGLGHLATITKLLGKIGDEAEIKIKDNRIEFKAKRLRFNYLLTQPDSIPTAMSIEGNPIKNLLKKSKYQKIDITKESLKELEYCRDTAAVTILKIAVDEDGVVKFCGGEQSTHNFVLIAGEVDDGDEYENIYDAELVVKILQTFDYSDEDELPEMFIADDKSLVVRQGDYGYGIQKVQKTDEE